VVDKRSEVVTCTQERNVESIVTAQDVGSREAEEKLSRRAKWGRAVLQTTVYQPWRHTLTTCWP
jgi:hypothetical protein